MKRTILTLMILATLILAGCGTGNTIAETESPVQIAKDAVSTGDKVRVHYVGTLDDGTEFDNSEKRGQPIEFVTGAGQMIAGFDNAIIGMKLGEVKNIKIPPAEAYGEKDPKAIQEVPMSQFPPDQIAAVGMQLMLVSPTGQQVPATVTAVNTETVTIDMNHQLAGQTLNFKVTLVEIL